MIGERGDGGDEAVVYRLSAPTVSAVTVVYDSLDNLLHGIREILEGLEGIGDADAVTLTVEPVAMSAQEMEALPEFDGY